MGVNCTPQRSDDWFTGRWDGADQEFTVGRAIRAPVSGEARGQGGVTIVGAQKKSRGSAVSRGAPMGSATFVAAPRGTAILMASRTATLIPLPGLFLGGRFPKRQFAKGSFIKQPDDRSDNIYLIEAGKVATFFLGPQGHDVPFPELEAGDFVGDLSAFGNDEPATYFQAVEDTTVLVMSQGQFRDALRSLPDFAELVAKTLCGHLRTMRRLYIENRLLPMKMRLYSELLRYGVRDGHGRLRISPMPTHAELARKIASQRETVTKQMSQLAKMGVVDNSDGFITIVDEAYLRSEVSKALGVMDHQQENR